MRYLPILLCAAALAAACDREPLFPGAPRYTHAPGAGRNGNTLAPEEPLSPGPHTYLTAVRYPDGYAWEPDTCAVEGTVWIDLYRDGKRILSVPAGKSVHPDMHRYAAGHLYADYTTDTETVLTCDGTELFRYEGREALRGFLVREDGVHTLGQDRDGSGFTYRVDGRVVFRSETGTVLGVLDGAGPSGGALTAAGEDVYYACSLPSERGSDYQVMRNAECYHSFPDPDGTRAVLVDGGKVSRVLAKPRKLLLEVDGTETVLALQGGEACLWCRMLPWEEDVLVLVCALGAGGKRYFLQSAGGKRFQPAAGDTVSDLFTDGTRLGWTVTGIDGTLLRFQWSDGGSLSTGGDAYLASGRCALVHEGHLLIALTGRNGTPNRFLHDSERTDIPFNGYFTSVTVE